MSLTSTSNCQLMAWPNALSVFVASVLIFVPVLSVKNYHPEWAGFNCTSKVGKGTVPHLVTGILETEDSLICCHPTTCTGGTIKFCTQDNGTDICIPCHRNGKCNYNNVTSEHLFTMIDFCKEELCTRKNTVPEVVFYPSCHTKKSGDDVKFQPKIHSDYELRGFIWRFVNTTGSYDIASSLTETSNRRKYKVGTLQNPYLSIIKIEPQDHGTYQLIVGNLIGPSNVTDVVLNVTAKPIVSMTKVSDTVDAGTSYVINCTIIGNEEVIKSTFFFENIRGTVTEISSNVSSNGLMTHTMLKTSSGDSGKYTCHAENSEGKAESTLHLTVDIPPEMYSPFAGRVMDSMIGDNISISLWVSQTPDLDDLNCKHQNSSSKQMSLSLPYNRSNVGMSFNYTIMDVQQNDNGTYVCTAINRLGSSNFSVKINVTFQRTTTAPLEEPKKRDCKLLCHLTICFTVISSIYVAVALILVHNQTLGRKKLICILPIILIYAVAVIVVAGHGLKDCSTNIQNTVAVFFAIDIISLIGTCCFCGERCRDVIYKKLENLFNSMTSQ